MSLAMKRALIVLAVVASSSPAWAHKPSDAHVRLVVDGTTLVGRVDVNLRDLDGALGLDGDGDGALTWGEVTASASRISDYLEQRLGLAADGTPCQLTYSAAALTEHSDGTYWAVPLTATCRATPHALTIDYRLLFDVDAQHRGLVHIGDQTLIIRDAAPVQATLGARTSFLSFVREGIWHIWIGLDHVLFLFCLILPAVFPRRDGRWQAAESLKSVSVEVLEIVTAFTLAHSITLVISAVGLFTLPSRFVETAIAASVVAAALNNLVRVIDARWAVAFALGLLHGFGFSSVLIDLGLPSGELIGSLLGFNLGVELGQAAIVVVLLPLLFVIRRTFAYQAVLWAGSGFVAILASVWTYQRWIA